MPYGVVAPGIHGVFNEYSAIERIMALYPYPKFRKFRTEEEAWQFVRRFQNKHLYRGIYKYGDTFDDLYVRMEYFIGKDCVCYNFRTKKIGYIRIISPEAEVQNSANLITAKLPNIFLNSDMISGHLIAIYHGLTLIGDFIDVDVIVPDHSIFYALATYKGQSKVINKVRDKINSRLGKLSVSLPDLEGE